MHLFIAHLFANHSFICASLICSRILSWEANKTQTLSTKELLGQKASHGSKMPPEPWISQTCAKSWESSAQSAVHLLWAPSAGNGDHPSAGELAQPETGHGAFPQTHSSNILTKQCNLLLGSGITESTCFLMLAKQPSRNQLLPLTCSLMAHLRISFWSPQADGPILSSPGKTFRGLQRVEFRKEKKKKQLRSWHPVHHFMANRQEKVETVTDFIFLGYKIPADSYCSHEIKRRLLFGRKAMTNLDTVLKTRDITLPTKVHLVKAMVFPVVTDVSSRMWLVQMWE